MRSASDELSNNVLSGASLPNSVDLRSAARAQSHHNVIVVGSGVAGMSVALGLAGIGTECTLVSQGQLGASGSTRWAQGGIAASVAETDGGQAHAEDTLRVGGDIALPGVVRTLIEEGPQAIVELVRRGARFDTDETGAFKLGREAGHSVRRIVHANGDATGAEVARSLTRSVLSTPLITVEEGVEILDLLSSEGQIVGVAARTQDGRMTINIAKAVVLATGGYAHCFERATAPREVIGTGIAIAARAGAALADMEFVQFHPTALDVGEPTAGTPQMPLLTEALRGEGATIVDELGRRFLLDVHPDAEMAPRDIVARANYRQLRNGHRTFLDASEAIGHTFAERFPTVYAITTANSIDPVSQPMPISPAAHYCMGGIATNTNGETSLAGLWALGEVASTGLHGANRLASNSLLEGLVMGHRVASSIQRALRTPAHKAQLTDSGPPNVDSVSTHVDLPAVVSVAAGIEHLAALESANDPAIEQQIRSILWRHAGVERTKEGLDAATVELAGLMSAAKQQSRTRNMAQIASLVLQAALARTESRGAHFRSDFPSADPLQATRIVVESTPETKISVTFTAPTNTPATNTLATDTPTTNSAATARVAGQLPSIHDTAA